MTLELLILLPIAVCIFLFVNQEKLRKRIEVLERRQKGLAQRLAGLLPDQSEPLPASEPDKPQAGKVQPPQAIDIPQRDEIVAENADQPVADNVYYVFTAKRVSNVFGWAQRNWFYLVAATSLGLAGVFLVQYGIENGLLPPVMRVAFALILGVSLIGAGEYLRRKGGDAPGELFAYLPSTFAAGGLVSMFAAVVSARVLYGLIGASPALAGLAAVAALAILIGWFYGPLLAAVGILGGIAAPFLVGGDPGSAGLLYYYFALIAVAALAVDTFRRWAWLSAFGSILAFLAAAYLHLVAGEPQHFIIFALILTGAAITIPERSLIPRHSGPMLAEILREKQWFKGGLSNFPTRLAGLVFIAASLVPLWVQANEDGTFWFGLTAVLILLAMATIWMQQARALADVTIVPLLVLPLMLVQEVAKQDMVWQSWADAINRLPEVAAPLTVTILLAIAIVVTLVLAWRSARQAPYPLIWAFAAAAFAPVVASVLEIFWEPARVIGANSWAWHVLAVAGVMAVLAERFARLDGAARQRVALFTLAALTMISLALILMLSDAALTLALGAMVLSAVLLDRRFDMAYLGIFVIAGVGVVGWRLVLEPGIFWAIYAPFWQFFAAYAGTVLLLGISWLLLAGRDRVRTFAVIDGAVWSLSATFASLLVYRLIDTYTTFVIERHASIGLIALVWLVSAANQLWRMRFGEISRWIRIALAVVYGVFGLATLALVLTLLNPLIEYGESAFGPYILDSLFIAYALPGLLFLAVAIRFDHLFRWLRYAFALFGGLLVAFYIALEIRRFWRGDNLSVAGVTDPELYSYTVAMLLASTGLLFYAFWKHSTWLRKLALVGIGLTVAKVFLIDFSGLTGLTRVFSFLVLGLSLAGLAWLDRWFGAREMEGGDKN